MTNPMPTLRRVSVWCVLSGLISLTPIASTVGQIHDSVDPDPASRISTTFPSIDEEIKRFMETIGATSATVAIGYQDRMVFSRGYGFSDSHGKVATTPRTTMRLASCSKPFTAALIRILIDRGDISQDTLVFEFLEIRPRSRQGSESGQVDGRLADARIKQITIDHLLKHRGGWNRQETLDPMYQISDIKKELRVGKMTKRHIVRYMWGQPLQFPPGSQEQYSNFGYLLLGLVIEKVTGKSYIESVRELLGDSLGADEISISSRFKQNRKSREVFYPNDNRLDLQLRDSASGLATNSETVCRFMEDYWIDGRKRDSDRNRYFFQYGTHAFTTTTVMEQRLDGINYAIMLNSRRNDTYDEDNEVIRHNFNLVLDSVRSRLILD